MIHMGPQDLKGWVPKSGFRSLPLLRAKATNWSLPAGAERERSLAPWPRDAGERPDGSTSWAQFVSTVANAAAVVTVDFVTGHIAACFACQLSFWPRCGNASVCGNRTIQMPSC